MHEFFIKVLNMLERKSVRKCLILAMFLATSQKPFIAYSPGESQEKIDAFKVAVISEISRNFKMLRYSVLKG